MEYCKKYNIVVEAYCPIIRGDFSNPVLQEVSKSVRILSLYKEVAKDWMGNHLNFRLESTRLRFLWGGRFRKGKEQSSQAVLNDYILSFSSSFVPLPKSSKPERVISNADVYDFELSESDMKKLDDIDQGEEGAISWNPTYAD